MATIIPGEYRERLAAYHVYNQPIARHSEVLVRRQVALPQDYLHANSRKVKLQRQRFSAVQKQWADLSPYEKRYWRRRRQVV